MLFLGDEMLFLIAQMPACVQEKFGELVAPIGDGGEIPEIPSEGFWQGDQLRVIAVNLCMCVVVAMLIAEMAAGQHDDETANIADHIVEPAGFEHCVMTTFMLKRKVVHEDDAVHEHRGPDP